jgi:hypothetical protein
MIKTTNTPFLFRRFLMNQAPWMTMMIIDRSRRRPWTLPETPRHWNTHSLGLQKQVEGFLTISLNEMDSVALLNRTDTKFIMTREQLRAALSNVQNDYRILSVAGQRLNHYRTVYFDTPDFELYNLHVNGRADCYKVRCREYTDSCQSFLEVKHKTIKDRTIRNRLPTPQPVIQLTLEAENWLNGVFPYDCRDLEPKVWNTFTRITLVSKKHCERVTLDVDLGFFMADQFVKLNNISVAEVKMDSGNEHSPFLLQMRTQRILPQGFSKYCIGVSMLYDQVKKNSLKPKLMWIEKLNRGFRYHG